MAKKINGFELEVQIHKAHDLVTTASNIANAETKAFTVSPGENQVLIFPREDPVQMKLFNTSGVELEDNAVISFWRVDDTGETQERFASVLYSTWKNIAISDQWKDQYADALSIGFLPKFDGGAIYVSPAQKLEIRVKSASVIDWSNANTKVFFGLAQELLR